MHDRLSAATLAAAQPNRERVTGPAVEAGTPTIGIVHFGIGAFHRAHQAVFTEDAAAATGASGWGILGVTGRSDSVVRQLRPQDCLYGVLVRGVDETRLRLVASVRDVAWPGEESDRIAEVIAAPATHLATLTITEKGYLRGTNGNIDLTRDSVQSDLRLIAAELADASVSAPAGASATPIGLLVRGLARRFRRGGAPFTVVPCDNLADNGPTTRRLVRSLVAALADAPDAVHAGAPDSSQATDPAPAVAFATWLDTSVTFPSTMVDRIAPATTEADRDAAEALLGLRDEALVVAEPFAQWVIEDDFAGPRPAWEKAGAILTDDVAPYERVKLRVLNASHSMLAYLGALRGHETIAEAVADPTLRDAVLAVLDDDILPTLTAPPGIDLARYRDTVLARFANPSLAHTTRQVGMDGSQKLPIRILSAARDRIAAGHMPRGLALAVAAWVTFIASTADAGSPPLDDPLADELHAAVPSIDALELDPDAVVARLFALDSVFPADLRDNPDFRAAVVAQLPVVRALADAGAPAQAG
ncbi:mannitol dehydrogenase family protein [Microbacterium sp. STN6]|uniref:mannitol dehydrogenase family protein n=1 Tax=Microbacterium sp. STN6 TaxID=2995588 RepID=UPI002260EE84|nr:mannitol dehydrogenase family protein [Microbacterium sp. STN6]MCX7523180.1 mannitol dehydrogenase family protein [Microbacterium sp. STN6]